MTELSQTRLYKLIRFHFLNADTYVYLAKKKDMKREYYLVTSEALANNLLFRDKEDFQIAHNYLAICKLNIGITLAAHCLMGNHFHLVVWSEPEILKKFLTAFKRRYSMWLHRKYGLRQFMSKIKFQIDYTNLTIEEHNSSNDIVEPPSKKIKNAAAELTQDLDTLDL